jgi:glycogen debranching enzyme
MISSLSKRILCSAVSLLLLFFSWVSAPATDTPSLTRAVRSWEFLPVVGTRAALLGNEAGNFEAWVYPLKIFRDFRLLFHVGNRVLPAESLARTLTVRPESSSILYADDTFRVRETIFVPVSEPGAVIILEIDTAQPLEIEAAFQCDFQLEWPAALGATYVNWNLNLHAFELGEELNKFSALVGSPSATLFHQEYNTNYSSSREDSLLLGPTTQGKDTKVLVVAGSVHDAREAEETFHRLADNYTELMRSSADYYAKYLNQTVSLTLPDTQLQQAYDWARMSTLQGMVNNPYLGTGLIAGYRTSGTTERPGFAWFFGRDALWSSFALDAEGDFSDTRIALDFLSRYQRADGKIPHEIAQSATFVDWFKDYPYPYASADATPLYLAAMNDYATQSGDTAFVQQRWESLWKAYEFLKSTYNAQGLPQNSGFGHGWVEGGPLLPVQTELYQSALGTEALRALSNLAYLIGKQDVGKQLQEEFTRQKQLVEKTFWSPDDRIYAYALDPNGQRIETPSVLAAVPLWFQLLDEGHANLMIDRLADSDHQTDWGMRIISSKNPVYDPGGYHYGSVWPLFTGWAAVGEYAYHRSLPAYSNLRSNALLVLDGSLGHATEVLSGDYYQPLSTSSPHQIWSAAMVVNPILRGMLGLATDASSQEVRFAPHVPAEWKALEIRNVHLLNTTLDLNYERTEEGITLIVHRTGSGPCNLVFSPALSPRTEVVSVDINGRPVSVKVQRNPEDQHAVVRFRISGGSDVLRIKLRNDFDVSVSSYLPPLGERSSGLRIISESWGPKNESLSLAIAGIPGKQYELAVWNPDHLVSVEGGQITKRQGETGVWITVLLPGKDTSSYVHGKIVIHFRP